MTQSHSSEEQQSESLKSAYSYSKAFYDAIVVPSKAYLHDDIYLDLPETKSQRQLKVLELASGLASQGKDFQQDGPRAELIAPSRHESILSVDKKRQKPLPLERLTF